MWSIGAVWGVGVGHFGTARVLWMPLVDATWGCREGLKDGSGERCLHVSHVAMGHGYNKVA